MKQKPMIAGPGNHIDLFWHSPLPLRDGSAAGLLYAVDDLGDIPDKPGIYVFARGRGHKVEPLYIGVATRSLRSRIKQQLNSVRLMRGLEHAARGRRVLLFGELTAGRPRRVLPSLELAMIRYAMGEGYDILNKHGTTIRAYPIRHRGNRQAHSWMPRRMEAEKVRRHRRP